MWLSATPGSSPRPLQSVARIPLLLLGGELGPHFCALSGVYSGGREKDRLCGSSGVPPLYTPRGKEGEGEKCWAWVSSLGKALALQAKGRVAARRLSAERCPLSHWLLPQP